MLEFTHDNEGIHIKYKNKYLLLNGCAISKELLNDDEILRFSKIILKFNQEIGRISSSELQSEELKISTPKKLRDIHNPVPFYKYISRHDYCKYYSKGHFQLGSSKYYRDIERNESRDGFEGYNISILQVNNFQIPITLFRCNNYLIFCGTSIKSSNYLQQKFGAVEMEILDSASFASNMAKTIGALDFTIAEVEYSNCKIAKSEHISIDQFSPEAFIQNEEIIELLLSTSLYPSLYVKPEIFHPEKELRIVFEMPDDYPSSFRFNDANLLDQIKFNQ
jgi:hypothetical protein